MAQKQHQRATEKPAEEEAHRKAPQEADPRLGDDTDAILDEIDSVLEENAAEFVRNYVQKGGE